MSTLMPDHEALRTPRLVGFMAVVACIASPVLLFPYLSLDRSAARVDTANTVMYVVLVVHVLTATTAIVLGVLQLVPRIRARRHVHRRIGRGFLVLGLVAYGLTAIPLAIATRSGNVTRYGTLVPAVGFLVCAWMGWTAARRRHFVAHRSWMVRAYALAFFALTTRVLVPLLLLLQLPWLASHYGGDRQAAVSATIPVAQWLGWIVDIAIAEYVVRRRLRPALIEVSESPPAHPSESSPATRHPRVAR